jgi:hypothetical protein
VTTIEEEAGALTGSSNLNEFDKRLRITALFPVFPFFAFDLVGMVKECA